MKKTLVGIVISVVLFTCSEATGSNNSSQVVGTTFLCDGLRNLISFVNNTECTAGAWEPNSYLSSIFNGRNGSAIIYNHWNDSGVYIPGRSLNCTWYNNSEPWSNYFSNLNLTQLVNSGRTNGTIFSISNISREILDEVTNAVTSWSPRSVDPNRNSFNSFTNISSNFSELFNGPLSGLLTMMGTQVIPLSYDIFALTEVLDGLSTFFNNLRGGLATFVNRTIEFNASSIFTARNGVEVLTYLLQDLQSFSDLNNLLSESLNCIQNFLQLVTQLGGSVCRGVTGRLLTIFEELAFGNQTCTSNNTLVTAESDARELLESVEALYNVTQNLGSEFAELRTFLDSLQKRVGSSGSLFLESG